MSGFKEKITQTISKKIENINKCPEFWARFMAAKWEREFNPSQIDYTSKGLPALLEALARSFEGEKEEVAHKIKTAIFIAPGLWIDKTDIYATEEDFMRYLNGLLKERFRGFLHMPVTVYWDTDSLLEFRANTYCSYYQGILEEMMISVIKDAARELALPLYNQAAQDFSHIPMDYFFASDSGRAPDWLAELSKGSKLTRFQTVAGTEEWRADIDKGFAHLVFRNEASRSVILLQVKNAEKEIAWEAVWHGKQKIMRFVESKSHHKGDKKTNAVVERFMSAMAGLGFVDEYGHRFS